MKGRIAKGLRRRDREFGKEGRKHPVSGHSLVNGLSYPDVVSSLKFVVRPARRNLVNRVGDLMKGSRRRPGRRFRAWHSWVSRFRKVRRNFRCLSLRLLSRGGLAAKQTTVDELQLVSLPLKVSFV